MAQKYNRWFWRNPIIPTYYSIREPSCSPAGEQRLPAPGVAAGSHTKALSVALVGAGKVGWRAGSRWVVNNGSCDGSVKGTWNLPEQSCKQIHSPDSCPSFIGQTVHLPGRRGRLWPRSMAERLALSGSGPSPITPSCSESLPPSQTRGSQRPCLAGTLSGTFPSVTSHASAYP